MGLHGRNPVPCCRNVDPRAKKELQTGRCPSEHPRTGASVAQESCSVPALSGSASGDHSGMCLIANPCLTPSAVSTKENAIFNFQGINLELFMNPKQRGST